MLPTIINDNVINQLLSIFLRTRIMLPTIIIDNVINHSIHNLPKLLIFVMLKPTDYPDR